MTVQEAQNSIGKEFRLSLFNSGILGRFDIIRRVKIDGYILGDFISAPCEACQLKLPQPAQLKKQKPSHELQIEKEMLLAQRDAQFKTNQHEK